VEGGAAECVEELLASCEAAEAALRDLREALGKHRGKGSGMARVLRRAAQALAAGMEPCIRGCGFAAAGGAAEALRCGLGEAVEELQRSLHGIAIRLDRVPRLSGETEEELAEALLDTLRAAVSSLCAAARRARLALEEGEAGG